jgi:hypothetical protein
VDVEILCRARWIGPAAAATEVPTEVEVLCKARWIVGTRP